MQNKTITIIHLVAILSLATLMVLQKDRVKTGIKIFLSQVQNSAWIYGETNNCKYRLAVPPEYRTTDDDKKYPLVVYLHGAGERGNDNRLPIYDLEYLGAGGKENTKAFQGTYPSFVYVPQCPKDATWKDPEILAGLNKTIAELRSKYPIDRERLYLIGYSMGGSGSYALAESFYQATNQNFAGIIRLAGQSLFNQQTHEIISKSHVWLHVGLKDAQIRIKAAETSFRTLAELHPGAIETSTEITIPNHPGTTRTLTLHGDEIAKLTEYTNDGHGISEFPFYDTYLLEWLFSQRAQK